ncbi:MAG: hypothetical protein NTV80_05890 [Verrucomicrobia bacterium]|nr:hypothetical protein [Verrucomicrobiota bacterium]
MFNNPITQKIATFLESIQLPIRSCALEEGTFLPGLALERGCILVDETKLLYPGDILHEAGHLAISTPEERQAAGGNLAVGGGEEMAAIAWSYAAALHIDIDPAIVFHPHGYRNGSDSLLENFRAGHYLAVPLLQWMGLCYDAPKAAENNAEPYPIMQRWLRN